MLPSAAATMVCCHVLVVLGGTNPKTKVHTEWRRDKEEEERGERAVKAAVSREHGRM
jgi:hypothetical protein